MHVTLGTLIEYYVIRYATARLKIRIKIQMTDIEFIRRKFLGEVLYEDRKMRGFNSKLVFASMLLIGAIIGK